jgi:hypothetical protein
LRGYRPAALTGGCAASRTACTIEEKCLDLQIRTGEQLRFVGVALDEKIL